MIVYLVLFYYYYLSIFIFKLLSVLLAPFKFYLILCCIYCFISYLCYCFYYRLYYYLSGVISWVKNVRWRPAVSFFFSSRHIWKHVLILFFVFLKSLFLKRTCFKFYLIAVLICYLYFKIYRGAHNVFGTLRRYLLWPSLFRVALNLARNEAWVPETLCSLWWCVGGFLTFKESCSINF